MKGASSVALRIPAHSRCPHCLDMIWKTIRLELASTNEFPRGSAGRAFLLNVPIDESGHIDRVAIERNPTQATVRRFWASEPDSFGTIEPSENNWTLRCGHGNSHEARFLLDAAPLNLNSQVNVLSPDGTPLPFRVASVRSANSRILP